MQDTCIEEREIIGRPGKPGRVTNDDVACWICRTTGGTLYNFTASRIGATFMLEIVGEGGKMTFHGDRPFELTLQLKDKTGGYAKAPEVVPRAGGLLRRRRKCPPRPLCHQLLLRDPPVPGRHPVRQGEPAHL